MKIFLSEVGWVLMSFLGGSLFRVFQFEILLHKLGNQNVASNFGPLCYFPPFCAKKSGFYFFQRHLMFGSCIGIVFTFESPLLGLFSACDCLVKWNFKSNFALRQGHLDHFQVKKSIFLMFWKPLYQFGPISGKSPPHFE